ncbi:MAG: hypothetical protein A2Y41_09780 [Spirochaetes bacterium GWB1_36_13]|nr:MAG: hypothetical protein A2Y41_09780 [Spirochaetes bacterium GWB1_36_13]
MKMILVIMKKELKGYLYSPIAYIIGVLSLALWGLFFYLGTIQGGFAGLQPMFSFPAFLLLFLVPLMTMKLIAEEKKKGTIELLFSLPVKPKDVVLGKYFAVSIIYLAILSISLLHTLFIFLKGSPEGGLVLSLYIGMIFEGLALIAIGFFMSTLTDSQVIAAISSLGISLFLLLITLISDSAGAPWDSIFGEISFIKHLFAFFKGVIDLKDIAFFILMIATGLTLSINYLENEKWRK